MTYLKLKGGDACLSSAAKMVLNDFQRGKLPYFVKPPGCTDEPEDDGVKIQDLTQRDPNEDEAKPDGEAKADEKDGGNDEADEKEDEASGEKKPKTVGKKVKRLRKDPAKKPKKGNTVKRKNDNEVDGVSLKKKKMKKPVKNSKKK